MSMFGLRPARQPQLFATCFLHFTAKHVADGSDDFFFVGRELLVGAADSRVMRSGEHRLKQVKHLGQHRYEQADERQCDEDNQHASDGEAEAAVVLDGLPTTGGG